MISHNSTPCGGWMRTHARYAMPGIRCIEYSALAMTIDHNGHSPAMLRYEFHECGGDRDSLTVENIARGECHPQGLRLQKSEARRWKIQRARHHMVSNVGRMSRF